MPNVWQQEFCQEIILTMDLTQSTLKEPHLSLIADAEVISVKLHLLNQFGRHENKNEASVHRDVVYRTYVSFHITGPSYRDGGLTLRTSMGSWLTTTWLREGVPLVLWCNLSLALLFRFSLWS